MDTLEHAQHIYARLLAAQYIKDGHYPHDLKQAVGNALAFAKKFAEFYEEQKK